MSGHPLFIGIGFIICTTACDHNHMRPFFSTPYRKHVYSLYAHKTFRTNDLRCFSDYCMIGMQCSCSLFLQLWHSPCSLCSMQQRKLCNAELPRKVGGGNGNSCALWRNTLAANKWWHLVSFLLLLLMRSVPSHHSAPYLYFSLSAYTLVNAVRAHLRRTVPTCSARQL